jgi:hypothetical protein
MKNTLKTTIYITEKPMAKCGAYSLGHVMKVTVLPVDPIQEQAARGRVKSRV